MKKDKTGENVFSKREMIGHIFIHILLVAICAISLFAFFIIIGSSFQSQDEIYKLGYRILPKEFSFTAYKYIFNNVGKIFDAYKITFITTIIGTVGGVWVTAGYGYVLSRKDYPYRNFLSIFILITMLFSGGLVASYIVNTKWLHMYNSTLVLILPLMLSPWNAMMMKSFFSGIPTEVIESAKIDGAGEFRIFTSIILPMSKPIIAAVSLFLALTYWNDYMYSLLYIESEYMHKLQYLLMKILTDMEFLNSGAALETGTSDVLVQSMPVESAKMAMCVIAAGPILFIFPFFQKYFVKGVSVGAVKG